MANTTSTGPHLGNAGQQAGQRPSDTAAKLGEAGQASLEKAKELASNVAEKTSQLASSAAHSASQAASVAGERADQGMAAVGSGMKSLAGSIREHVPQGGMLGSASSSLAGSLESGGRYLQDEGLKGMTDDVTALIRKNPIPAVLLGIGLGFMLARMTRD